MESVTLHQSPETSDNEEGTDRIRRTPRDRLPKSQLILSRRWTLPVLIRDDLESMAHGALHTEVPALRRCIEPHTAEPPFNRS